MAFVGSSEIDYDLHILDQKLKGQVETGMQGVLDIAQNISEFCKEDESLKNAMRQMMVEYIEMEAEIKNQTEALKCLKQMSGDVSNPTHCFDEKLKTAVARNKTNPTAHPRYQEMENKMDADEEMIVDQEFEQLKATLLGSTQEDDIALTQSEVNVKCPFSGKTMVNPVRNTVCGHVYDREPILRYIKDRKKRAKCPVGGCPNVNPIDSKKLLEHTDMKKYINYLNRQKETASTSR